MTAAQRSETLGTGSGLRRRPSATAPVSVPRKPPRGAGNSGGGDQATPARPGALGESSLLLGRVRRVTRGCSVDGTRLPGRSSGILATMDSTERLGGVSAERPVRVSLAPEDYVEEVRFGWERELEASAMVRGAPDLSGEPVHMPISRAVAPRLYTIADEVMGTLQCQAGYELCLTRAADGLNAQALFHDAPFRIRLIGRLASLLGDGGLRAIFGHEIGHYLAHRPSPRFPGRRVECDNLLSVAREITADRFSLLACQDLAAAVELEIASMTGERMDALGVDAMAFLDECRTNVVTGRVEVMNDTHPSRELRLYAMWLFSRSTSYARLTGKGPGDQSTRQIDAHLRAHLLKDAELPLRAPPDAVHGTDPLDETASPRGGRGEEVSRPAEKGLDLGVIGRDFRDGVERLRTGATTLLAELTRVRRGPAAPIPENVLEESSPDVSDLEERFRALEARLEKRSKP
jgi:hypothetical protein